MIGAYIAEEENEQAGIVVQKLWAYFYWCHAQLFQVTHVFAWIFRL